MPWPESITSKFELVNRPTNDYYEYSRPFSALLYELFPDSEHYHIYPDAFRTPGSIKLTSIYVIARRNVPVFFIEIKTDIEYYSAFRRKTSDNELREVFLEFSTRSLPIPKLYGLSTFGTRFCLYEFTTASGSLTPRRIDCPPDVVIDTAPKEMWNFDVLEPEGEARLKEVVEHIKTMVADLPNDDCQSFFLSP